MTSPIRKLFAVGAVLAVALMPAVVFAAPSWLPLVQCGASNQVPCTPCDFFALGKRLIDMVLYGITGPIAAFIIVIAGGMMLLGGANPAQFAQGKKLLTNTLIGVGIILLSWVFTNFLIKSLGNGSATDSWNTFTCPAELRAISAIDTQFKTGGTLPPAPAPQAPLPANIGVPSVATRQDLCATSGPGGRKFDCGSCRNVNLDGLATMGTYFDNYGGADSKLLNAIMYQESSCKEVVSDTLDYGPMQFQVATARKFGNQCDVYERDQKGNYVLENGQKKPIPINAGFLLAPGNAEYIVCMAAAYVDTLRTVCGDDPRSIYAGYNAGAGYCKPSQDCVGLTGCSGQPMRAFECPWDNRAHTVPNTGLSKTRETTAKVGYCATH